MLSDPQIIYKNGERGFAVLPWDEYAAFVKKQYDLGRIDEEHYDFVMGVEAKGAPD